MNAKAGGAKRILCVRVRRPTPPRSHPLAYHIAVFKSAQTNEGDIDTHRHNTPQACTMTLLVNVFFLARDTVAYYKLLH